VPKVSVIIPTYNRAGYVCEAIDSLLAQTYRDFEIVVVDDGSTDDTCEVLRKYGEQIRYVYRENGGEATARNTGLRHARGKYIAFLDSDDVFLPWRLESHVPLFDDFPKAGMVWSKSAFFRGPWRSESYRGLCTSRPRLETEDIFEDLLLWRKKGMLIDGITVRSECFDAVGPFDESLTLAPDYDMWLRIAAHYPVLFLDTVVAGCRIHHGQMSLAGFRRGEREAAFEHILDNIIHHLPPERDADHVLKLVERRKRLIAFEKQLVPLLLDGKVGEACDYLREAFHRDPVLARFQDQVAETIAMCASALDMGDPTCPRSVLLLQTVLKGIPDEYRNLRKQLGEYLAYRYAQRGFQFAGNGRRMRSIGCGVQALRHKPSLYMARTLGSICRTAKRQSS